MQIRSLCSRCHFAVCGTSQGPNLPSIARALERGVSVKCRDKIFYSFLCQLENHSVVCRLGINDYYNISVNFISKQKCEFCIFPSFGRWVSSVGVNFECRCLTFFFAFHGPLLLQYYNDLHRLYGKSAHHLLRWFTTDFNYLPRISSFSHFPMP